MMQNKYKKIKTNKSRTQVEFQFEFYKVKYTDE